MYECCKQALNDLRNEGYKRMKHLLAGLHSVTEFRGIPEAQPMIRENQQLVTDEPVEFEK